MTDKDNDFVDKGGRPKATYSRRRLASAAKALNRILANPKMTAVHTLRTAELIFALNNIPIDFTGTDIRLKRSVRELCQESNLERLIHLQVDEEVRKQLLEEHEMKQAAELVKTKRMFDSVMDDEHV